MKKTFYCIIGVLVAVAITGGYFYPKNNAVVKGASPIGIVQTSPQMYQFSFNASTTATTTAGNGIYNAIVIPNNSNDRMITGSIASCNNVAKETQTTTFQLQAATSTISTTTNSSYAINLTLATTSTNEIVSSSTGGTTGTGIASDNYLWPAGVNLIFATTATDTAVCNVQIPYLQL
jgi:hypothetical protein